MLENTPLVFGIDGMFVFRHYRLRGTGSSRTLTNTEVRVKEVLMSYSGIKKYIEKQSYFRGSEDWTMLEPV